MASFFRKRSNRQPSTNKRQKAKRLHAKLSLEHLEPRLVPTGGVPTPAHGVMVIDDNQSFSDIIGSTAAPYTNSLASGTDSALFTQSFAVEPPSQPNYLDLFSGCCDRHGDLPARAFEPDECNAQPGPGDLYDYGTSASFVDPGHFRGHEQLGHWLPGQHDDNQQHDDPHQQLDAVVRLGPRHHTNMERRDCESRRRSLCDPAREL